MPTAQLLNEPRHEKICLRPFATTCRLLSYRATSCMRDSWKVSVLYYLGCKRRGRWSDCADAKAVLRLCFSHMAQGRFSHLFSNSEIWGKFSVNYVSFVLLGLVTTTSWGRGSRSGLIEVLKSQLRLSNAVVFYFKFHSTCNKICDILSHSQVWCGFC